MAGRASRYWQNPFNQGINEPASPEQLWGEVMRLVPELRECATAGLVINSRGRWDRDYSMYTGLAGVGLALWRLGLHCRHVLRDEPMAVEYLSEAKGVAARCLEAEPRSEEVSFFCGTPGYLALHCAASAALGEAPALREARLEMLRSWAPAARGHAEDELLFGRAGYIYALLWSRRHCQLPPDAFSEELRQTAEAMVESGKRSAGEYPDWPLMWHCFDEPYLGAAHGHVGNLAMLFRCFPLLCDSSQRLVRQTLAKLLSIRFPSGNLPIILDDREDHHIHWCHGAPGLPALLAAAAETSADAALTEAARRAGDVVWERGIILKGNGLCHVICGNGYTFLSLHRLTGDAMYISRAKAFATLLFNPELQAAISRQPDGQRRVRGKPDSPRSLMEGSAGVVCYLLDMFSPEAGAFPGWEL